MTSRLIPLAASVFAIFALFPAGAFAQASITGVAKDASGAVLPGVTVEASSPVLIEKVRTVVTDGAGQYRIIDLRPGVYTVTFALAGFAPVRREGIELAGSFTATVNADLKVGSLEETITVTGESAIVDVQNTLRERVMTKDVMDVIPAGRSHVSLGVLIPGMVRGGQDVGGTNTLALIAMTIHGGRSEDQRLLIDGLTIRNIAGAGQTTNFIPDMGSAQEVAIDYGANSAEAITGGVTINYIPREGGNTFRGSFFGTVVNSDFQGSNYTQELADLGLRTPNSLKYAKDINPSGGGPIVRDKLWFYSTMRWQTQQTYVAGLWNNLNAGNPARWDYAPDYNDQAVFALEQYSVGMRLSWQLNPKNKFNAYYEHQTRDYDNVGLPTAPESNQHWVFPRNHSAAVTWTSPVTNRLLLEGRVGLRSEDIRNIYPTDPNDPFRYLIAVTEQGGLIPGMRYRGKGVPNDTSTSTFDSIVTPSMVETKASLSYVTGSHAFKFGFGNLTGAQTGASIDIPTETTYRFNNGIPNQIQERGTIYQGLTWRLKAEMGLYAQDRWTLKRLALNLGLRYDYVKTGFDELYLGPVPLIPTRNITFPASDWYNFKDLSPRLGASYDVFGTGRTALKLNLSRYNVAADPSQGNPVRDRLVNRVTRTWTDANANYNPDCDLVNPLQQDLRASGGDFCGTISDLRFGQAIPSQTYNPDSLAGFGVRPYNWEFSAGVQHEVMPRVSMDVGYFRRIYGNFIVTDNRAVTAQDYGTYSITAPSDQRLPNGGSYPVSNLFDVNPNRVGLVDNYITFADDYGKQTEHWNGMDFSVNARPRNGVLLQGGISTGRTSFDNCEIRAQLPELSVVAPFTVNPTNPNCHIETAFLTQAKLLGSYSVPKVDVQVSATFQSLPGPQILSNFVATNALIQPSLGRALSNSAPNATVNIVAPGTMYGERLNQLDLRFVKVFRFGRTRTNVNLDVYNVLNGNAIRTVNNNYASWLTPTAILDARLFKISAQVDF
jgi:Carboxypeptidase regulatory-like domain